VKELRTEVEVEAPAERVWQVLTDFQRYPEWNPQIIRIIGELRRGATLQFEGRTGEKGTMKFRPALLVVEPNCELRWLGRLWLPGLFDGEHRFQIDPLGEGRVRFRQSEQFRGLLVPLLWLLIGRSTEQGFRAMNAALKARAEATG
jgi:hypothetical protein